jgi:hypothetical protein
MRSRRIAIAALATLALTVSVGLASAHSMPSAADFGLTTANDASGLDVPDGVDGGLNAGDENDNETPDASGHGADVSAAAQAETPEGYDNHGAYVSSVAKGWGAQVSGNAAANH